MLRGVVEGRGGSPGMPGENSLAGLPSSLDLRLSSLFFFSASESLGFSAGRSKGMDFGADGFGLILGSGKGGEDISGERGVSWTGDWGVSRSGDWGVWPGSSSLGLLLLLHLPSSCPPCHRPVRSSLPLEPHLRFCSSESKSLCIPGGAPAPRPKGPCCQADPPLGLLPRHPRSLGKPAGRRPWGVISGG